MSAETCAWVVPSNLRRFVLRRAALVQQPVDLHSERRLQQFLLGIREAQIGEHIAAALLVIALALHCWLSFSFVACIRRRVLISP
jgi:hypothetical protein